MIAQSPVPPLKAILCQYQQKNIENQKLNPFRSALLHMKTRVSLKYFVNDCCLLFYQNRIFLLQKCFVNEYVFWKDELSVLPVLHLLLLLFHTMFSLLVILFVIKLYARNNTFKQCFDELVTFSRFKAALSYIIFIS